MKHDLLHIQGKPYVLVPLHEYRTMSGNRDNISNDEIPDEILDMLCAKQDTALKILRKYRGLTQKELADAAGLSRPYLTEIERGNKDGSIRAIKALAEALQVNISLLAA